MAIYLTLKFAFESLGGLEIEFAAFIILDFILIGWLWTFSLSSIEKKITHQGDWSPTPSLTRRKRYHWAITTGYEILDWNNSYIYRVLKIEIYANHAIYINHNILNFWIYFRFFHNFASRSPILMIFTFLKMALKFIEKKISGGGGIRTHEHQS